MTLSGSRKRTRCRNKRKRDREESEIWRPVASAFNESKQRDVMKQLERIRCSFRRIVRQLTSAAAVIVCASDDAIIIGLTPAETGVKCNDATRRKK